MNSGHQAGSYNSDYRADAPHRPPSSSASPSVMEDDSGFTDEASELNGGGLIDDLLGPRFKSQTKGSSIHIHIGAVHYHRSEPYPRGDSGGPTPPHPGYCQLPPQPCQPWRGDQYVSSPSIVVHSYDPQSSAVHTGNNVQRPPFPVSENISLQRLDRDIKVDKDELPPGHGIRTDSNQGTEGASCDDTALEDSVSRLMITQSEQSTNGVPTHLDVSMEMEGDRSVVWTGQLQCAPSAPDLRPRTAAIHRPRSVIYINSGQRQGSKTVSREAEEIEYVNYSQPFSKAQAYRLASAGDPSSSDNTQQIQNEGARKPAASISRLDQTPWKSASNLPSYDHFTYEKSKKSGGSKCSTFSCVPEGFYPDVEDDNEKAHIKECLNFRGKSGNWVILPLQSHPMNRFCLEVKSQDDVLSFPVMLTHKKKYKIDPSRKGFKCVCKLVEFYKRNKLPSCNLNLGLPFPKSSLPPLEAEADTSDEIKRQYAGIRL